ncbi:DUF4304 domain-containing protein [Leeuwenhoekiella sp. MAR_2009_132]|uniref:DUF4304 domain-containing protein n=1 Tax=Leeuwenhoekiella sp. MAR_2009_132 TaxID=1392489 RepID=UPI00048E1138|nr:DUF4304 domain-containing protein [Leeuwenhoekiella sp. MAR_2009_132]
MGLFDFLKNKSEPIEKKMEEKSVGEKSKNVQYLNQIQKEVHQYLKPLGFKKRGRTFNRQTENGVWQLINFQSGQFPVGENYVIPGIRESLYGKFTVNMGVIIKELYEIQMKGKQKAFYQDYDCQIRTRLSHLISEDDYWWDITNESEIISDQIIEGLNEKGISWFDMFETREKICVNWGNIKGSSKTSKLDVALIIFQTDKKKGGRLIQEYYNNIELHKGHKEYVKELANGLGLKLTENEVG